MSITTSLMNCLARPEGKKERKGKRNTFLTAENAHLPSCSSTGNFSELDIVLSIN
jgi:hypothetical protein